MKAVLRKIALTNLVLSVTETYKHEALGVIFGKVEKDFIKIINAIPYQTAKRKFNEVDDSKKSKIIKKIAENSHVMIGDFHSHSDFKSGMHAKLSPQDIKDLKAGVDYILNLPKDDYALMSSKARERILNNFSCVVFYFLPEILVTIALLNSRFPSK